MKVFRKFAFLGIFQINLCLETKDLKFHVVINNKKFRYSKF